MKTSVAMCTYNGEKFLKEQIDSILGQTIKVDEIIVCDDRSTDSTQKILRNYSERFPDVFKIYINEKNLGSVKNFEKAAKLCSNEIVFFCDQDDIWLPEKVDDVLNTFKQNPSLQVVCTNAKIITEDGKIIHPETIWDLAASEIESSKNNDYFQALVSKANFATGATMAFRKEFLSEVLPLPKELHHDEWFAIAAASRQAFAFLKKTTIFYRIHSTQQVGGVYFEEKNKRLKRLKSLFNGDSVFQFDSLRRMQRKRIKMISLFHELLKTEDYFFLHDAKEKAEKYYLRTELELRKTFPVRTFFLNLIWKIKFQRK